MASINLQNVQIKNGSTWYKMCPFPVGFIYLSQNSTSPATTFGGTWSVLNEDRFLRPSNAWATGGSKKISVNQLPSHTHGLNPLIIKYFGDGSGTIRRGDSAAELSGLEKGDSTYSTGGGKIIGPNIETVTLGIVQLRFGEVGDLNAHSC